MDNTYIKQYAVFSGGRYWLYQAIRSIFGVDSANIKQYDVFSRLYSAYIKQYAVAVFHEIDTPYTKQY